ncbi:MAG: hypothetical protein E7278_06490 [Lachnospiraceae bacterium]|jgi:hypothetical protein|nr:hypothetical protein [Lachnospiraceae bacterium]
MNQEDKKKLQNDILLATEISRQFTLKNPEEARKVVAFLHSRKPFLSPRGAAFQQRIEALAEDSATSCTCMLCMQKEAEDGIFCRDCMAVIDRSVNRDSTPVKEPEEAPEETPVEEVSIEKIPEEETPVEEVQEAPIEDEGIEEEFFEEVPEVTPVKKAESVIAPPQLDVDLWGDPEKERKKLPIWARILLVLFGVVILAVAVLLITGYRLPISGLPWEEVSIESEEDGTKVVEREFSEKDYDITAKDPLNAPEGMFEVRVGDYVGESWDTGLIEVYAYSVVSKEDPAQSAVIWVAGDGRTVGYGTLVDAENPGKIYRIR